MSSGERAMNYWSRLQALYRPLQLRERALVIGAVLVLVLFGGYSLFVEPTLQARTKAQAEIANIQQQNQQFAQQLDEIKALLEKDPGSETLSQIAQLEQEQQQINEALGQSAIDLISPELMATALEDVLANGSGAQLLALTTLPAEEVSLVGEGEPSSSAAQDGLLYRHPLTISISANFAQVRALVGHIQALPWRFYWRGFDFTMKDYPQGELTLELFTLSTSQEWLRTEDK